MYLYPHLQQIHNKRIKTILWSIRLQKHWQNSKRKLSNLKIKEWPISETSLSHNYPIHKKFQQAQKWWMRQQICKIILQSKRYLKSRLIMMCSINITGDLKTAVACPIMIQRRISGILQSYFQSLLLWIKFTRFLKLISTHQHCRSSIITPQAKENQN